jgi:Holliday junction DNA helicase RuvA
VVVVLGIDPGTAHTGYGVVLARGRRLAALDGGVIGTGPSEPLERRLTKIHTRLCDLIAEHRPDAVAVEQLYFGQNARTAFAVGQARGVALLSAGMAGVPCFSYTPQQVKLAVCGAGPPPRTRCSAWSARCCACPSTPSPTTRRTPLPWPSATPTAPLFARPCRCPGRRPALAAESGAMIASVRGPVLLRRPGEVVLDAGGVGYRLAVSAETLRAVPAAGREATLHSHLVVRDDAIQLYGFATEAERELFLMLIGVQGVGPKVALAVLSGGTPRELLNAIATGDSARFQAVPGIGKRTADRVIVELREKVAGRVEDEIVVSRVSRDDPRTLAREGLLGLGFGPSEADELLDRAEGEAAKRPAGGESPGAEELIAGALRAAR